jgi:hypothetical protein
VKDASDHVIAKFGNPSPKILDGQPRHEKSGTVNLDPVVKIAIRIELPRCA